MRFLYVGNVLLPDKNAACFRVLSNIQSLRSLGYEVDLIGTGDTLFPENGQNGFNVSRGSVLNSLRGQLKIARFVITNSSKYKYLIFYNYPVFINIILIFTKGLRWYREHVVLDITEWYECTISLKINALVKYLDVAIRNKILFRLSRRLLITSPFYETRVGAWQKTLDVPTLFEPSKCRKFKKIDSPCVQLIYIGNPGIVSGGKAVRKPKERIDLLVLALSKSNSVTLSVIGVSGEEFKTAYPSIDCPPEKIKFLGRLPNDIAKHHLVKSDCMVFLRDNNRVTQVGFPGKMAEAITHGIPVVTSNLPSLKKYSKYQFITLIDNKRFAELIDSIFDPIQLRAQKQPAYDSKLFHYESFNEKFQKFFSD